MPVIETKGAASSGGFGQFARQAPVANYIEDVFSTWLYTGNSAGQTIANGIDLAGKGGLVWIKDRFTSYGQGHVLLDSARGTSQYLQTQLTNAQGATTGGGTTSFLSNGFSFSGNVASPAGIANYSGFTLASWTFRKQAKFFDVVTYTGTGSNLTVNHNLGSAPGCIIIKDTSNAYNWIVYHRSLATGEYLVLNSNAAKVSTSGDNVIYDVTSTSFKVASYYGLSYSGDSYVAYIFAHDAGGFGLTGTDNVISCGSFTTDGSGFATVTLGWEPQWFLVKKTNGVQNWLTQDVMRGASHTTNQFLYPNTTGVEGASGLYGFIPTATGFSDYGALGAGTFAYIAIRRGPMRTPTSGTSVYSNLAYTGDQTDNRILSQGSSAPNDLFMFMDRTNGAGVFSSSTLGSPVYDRLRGISVSNTSASKTATALGTQFTNAETGVYAFTLADTQTNFSVSANFGRLNTSAVEMVVQMFRRAPGFFDVVCYTGDGTNPRNISHNLGAVPELMLVKRRGPNTQNWLVYHGALGAAAGLVLNTTAAATNPASYWSATPTSTQFSTQLIPNSSGENYVAYLFASCPGVSKVGSYTGTGTGTTQQINCGFTGGARFVMIKRTDSTGAWYVWDSARGIVAGNDPYVLLNSTISEVTATDYIDTLSTGFEISIFAPNAINANGGSYIFLAIA